MQKTVVEIVFAEFGSPKFTPNIKNVKAHFPEAEIKIITDVDVTGPFIKTEDHWGHKMNDYWKVKKLIESEAEIAMSMDADMKIVSEFSRAILPLAKRFGLCLPANPRKLVKIDTEIGSHSDGQLDETLGMGYAVNMSPIIVDKSNWRAVYTLETFCRLMEINPVRGPLAMWRACYQTGFFPCLLPPQWCVCAEDVGIGSEIMLHIGHQKVREHYGV